jgi:hypothetical protein
MHNFGYIYTRSHESYQQYNACKLGETENIPNRDTVYATSEIKRGHFDNVFEVISGKQEEIESALKNEFKPFNIAFDGGSEFFDQQIIPLIEPYLINHQFEYRKLTSSEINILERTNRFKKIIQKPSIIKIMRQMINKFRDKRILKKQFFETFLPNKRPRRIQSELWDTFKYISSREDKYRGIVQWATGTGKTIATLMLFVLSAESCKKKGEIFRGLLISPKNDIFNTIVCDIRKLEHFGITICEGHNAQLTSLQIPTDKHVLITTTHASLTDHHQWLKLPPITHCHYDEVHHATGDIFYKLVQENIKLWDTKYLTGTSATPKTCIASQHNKLGELFGNPINILHKCDVDEAISEGWIAQPRFGVNVISKGISKSDTICSVINILQTSIADKHEQQKWRGGKVIVYMPSRSDVSQAVIFAKEMMPCAEIYSAVEGTTALSDDMFVKDVADGTIRVLFACERYREGSDIFGLEMTVVLMGDTIGAHIVIQIAGRALRNDYIGKEGWCIIIRPSEDGTVEDDVFDSIMLQMMDFIGNSSNPSQHKVRQMVEKYFGRMEVSGKIYDVEETVLRIQTFYARKAFEHATPKEKYEVVRNLNRDLMIQTKEQYNQKAVVHLKFIENPKFYFKDQWISWCHYIGVDTSAYPQTKSEWVNKCKEVGMLRWYDYKELYKKYNLPENPCEMYEDYTNWDKEIGTSDDYVW